MSGLSEHEVPWLPVLEQSVLGSEAARSSGQLLAWLVSLAFHTAMLAVLAWGTSALTVRPKLAGNPEVVTLICSQASVASPPQTLEVKIPQPQEEPVVEPPVAEELPPVPEPTPPELPDSDSLEVLHAVARNQTPQHQNTPQHCPQPQSIPIRKLLARAELPALEAPVAEEPDPKTQSQRPVESAAAPARKVDNPRKPRAKPVRRLPAARQRQLPSPATRAAPLADAVGTDRTKAPRAIFAPEPAYPEIFPRPTGTVWLTLLIGKDGRVLRAEVYKSSGHPALDRAAQKGVMQWRWQPATRGGKPVQARVRVGVNFVDD